MMTLKRIALIAMALVAAATSPALAGTKYAANLVANATIDPPPNPTLSPKSSVKLSDKGSVSVALDGVTNAGGTLVTTSTVYADSTKLDPAAPVLDGSEYIVIIKLVIPSIANLIPLVEVPVPVDLKGGKGKTKLSLAALLGNLPGGAGRSVGIPGAEVWGPVGFAGTCNGGLNSGETCLGIAECPDVSGSCDDSCLAIVSNPLPVGLPLGAKCRGGTQLGISGIAIPLP